METSFHIFLLYIATTSHPKHFCFAPSTTKRANSKKSHENNPTQREVKKTHGTTNSWNLKRAIQSDYGTSPVKDST